MLLFPISWYFLLPSLSTTPCCPFSSVSHFSSHSNCHSPPLTFSFPLYANLPLPPMPHYRMRVSEAAEAYVSLSAKRKATVSVRLLMNCIHPNLFHPTHFTLFSANYKATAHLYKAADRRWAAFMVSLYDLYNEKRKRKTKQIAVAQYGPLVTDKTSTDALQRLCSVPVARAVLSLFHTICSEVYSWYKTDAPHWTCF